MKHPQAHIGTSGWNYRHWRTDFYPREVKQADWLGYFAGHFNSVEVNNSFYRVPTPDNVTHWQGQVPSGFRFAVKLWRGITHFKKLKDSRTHLETFFKALQPLKTSHRGPLLIQLPPNQGRDLPKLDAFLNDLKAVTHPARWMAAVEFRNSQWLCGDLYDLLDRQRVALCLHDMGDAAIGEPNSASFVYVRRHGPNGDYRGSYSAQQIAQDAQRVRGWLAEGRMVFAYYNNDAEAHAVRNARQLAEAVAG